MKTKSKTRRVSRKREATIQEEIGSFVAICRLALEDFSISEIAERANLSYNTIAKLFTGKTRFPRFLTVQKIGLVAGLKLDFTDTGARMRVVV